MATESGGNPAVVNKWDSNWLRGTPSVGLMQVIGPTFAAYAGRYRGVGPFEYGVSENPFANIYAGINYAIHRYGNPGWLSVLGHGHGYDQGGFLPPGVSLAVNNTGRPEQVIPAGRRGSVVRLEVISGGQSEFDRFMATWIRKFVRVSGQGNVQAAFGHR
jgi:SLT domain-containing protein